MKYPRIMKYVGKYHDKSLVIASKSADNKYIECFDFLGLKSWFSCTRKELRPVADKKTLNTVKYHIADMGNELSSIEAALNNSK